MFIITRNMRDKIMSVFSYDYMGAGLRNEVKDTLTLSVYRQCIFFVVTCLFKSDRWELHFASQDFRR